MQSRTQRLRYPCYVHYDACINKLDAFFIRFLLRSTLGAPIADEVSEVSEGTKQGSVHTVDANNKRNDTRLNTCFGTLGKEAAVSSVTAAKKGGEEG